MRAMVEDTGPMYEWMEEEKTKYAELCKSNRKAMNRNWSNQKANPALKTKTGNK